MPVPETARVPAAVAAGVVAGCATSVAATLIWATPWPAVAAVVLTALVAPVLARDGWRRQQAAAQALTLARERAREQAVRDELTGCLDPRGMALVGEQVLASVRRSGDAMHAAVVQVAGLPALRLRGGVELVDETLVAVADGLRCGTRGTDVVARSGGDEFVVLGPGAGCGAAELERRVRVHLADTAPASREAWPHRVTVGCAVLQPWDGGGLGHLVDLARTDLSLRLALRGPSAPEPVRRPMPD